MAYLEELLPEFRNGAKIRRKCWSEGMYIPSEGRFGLNFTEYDARADDWEFYQQPIDWQYVIDHKCLCYFWDNKGDEKQIGHLTGNQDNRFYLEAPEDCFNSYTYCRPVRKDEVTFYEERNDDEA